MPNRDDSYHIRNAAPSDEPFLWEMLYQSIYVPEGKIRPDRSLVQEPAFAHYLVNWGQQHGDEGLIAVDTGNNEPIGAVWTRIFTEEDPGWGFVDSDTPELGIAVLPEHRGKGMGTALLTALMSQMAGQFKALSLSVDPDNPVMSLYKRLDFEIVGQSGTSLTMYKQLEPKGDIT